MKPLALVRIGNPIQREGLQPFMAAKPIYAVNYNYGEAAQLFELGLNALQKVPVLMDYYTTMLNAHQITEVDFPERKHEQLQLALAAQAYVVSCCYPVSGGEVEFKLAVPTNKADKRGTWQKFKNNNPISIHASYMPSDDYRMLEGEFNDRSKQDGNFVEVVNAFKTAKLITDGANVSKIIVKPPSVKTTIKRGFVEKWDVLGAKNRANKHLNMLFA